MTIRPCGESVSRVLTGQRINVVAAASGAKAICLIDQYAPDLLITDLCMHGIDGWKLLFHEDREAAGVDLLATAYFHQPLDFDQ